MEQNTNMIQRKTSIPPIVWFLGIGLVIALIAIFVFDVAVSTAAYYGLLALMVGGHFFMHGSHGGHGGHQYGPTSNTTDSNKNEPSGHAGGCH